MRTSGGGKVLAIAALLVLNVTAMGSSLARAAGSAPEASSLTGQLLVAAPEMPDPRFRRTVIYMVHHDAAGAVGVAVNRPIGDVPLARLLEESGLKSEGVTGNIRMHAGGPVEQTRAMVLHSADYRGAGTELISGTVALTGDPDILRAIAAGTGPRRRLFVLGYAGWGPGQLEAEIKAGGWVTVPADEALVFDEDYDSKWDRALARRIIDL